MGGVRPILARSDSLHLVSLRGEAAADWPAEVLSSPSEHPGVPLNSGPTAAVVLWRTYYTSPGVQEKVYRRTFPATCRELKPVQFCCWRSLKRNTGSQTFPHLRRRFESRKMADSVEHEVSSTTAFLSEEVHHYQAEPEPALDQPRQDLFSVDDIVDLVGGAQDALERHLAEDNASHELTESEPEDPACLPEPVSVPRGKEPEPEPDSTSYSSVPETPEVVAPKAEPESTKIEPEPWAAAEPEPAPAPAPRSDALPVAEPQKAAPTLVEAADRPAVTEEPRAPASCECLDGRKPDKRVEMRTCID